MPRTLRLTTITSLFAAGLLTMVAVSASAEAVTNYQLRLAAGERQVLPQSSAEFFLASKSSPYSERGAIIQFYQLPTGATRQGLEALGVRLYEYLPDMAFLASIPATVQESDIAWASVRWVGTLQTEEKLAEPLRISTGTPSWARDEAGVPRFTVKVYGHISVEDAAAWMASEYGGVIIGVGRLTHAVDVALPADNWFDLAADERVRWIEPFWPRRETNNSNRTNTEAETAQAPPYSLDGSGVMVGEWDGGGVSLAHADFGGRVVSGDGAAAASHATHVAGTVLGSGAQSSGNYRGMAPAASMVSYQWWGSSSELESDYQAAIDGYGIDLTTNSWGIGYPPSSIEQCEAFLGNYFSECGTLDDIIAGGLGKTLSVCWAAGNERSGGSDYCGSLGMTWGTIIPFGTAKNTITIGAINSNNSTMTGFSSWGPVDDGRIKPELVAPGCQSNGDFGVTSTRVGGGYAVACGTSMATPTAAGCLTLWLERYQALYPGQVPLASTVKAAFIQSADDLGDPGPEYDFGYGRINVPHAVDIADAAAFFEDEITDGDTLSWIFAFDGNQPEVRFTLAWDDPAAVENANPTLINDIDMRVKTAGPFPITLRPWSLNPSVPENDAIPGEDHTNNIEQVWRDTQLMGAGTWTLQVIGHNIPSGPQKFSIAHNPGFVMVPEQQPYAASFAAGADIAITPGNHAVDFLLFNTGREDDTYDITLTSARGWNLAPNPTAVAIPGRGDSVVAITHSIPLGTDPGIADTIIGTFTSQAQPAITGADTLVVTVIAGYGVAITALDDTASVPGKDVTLSALLTNTGTQADGIDWSVSDDLGWAISPLSGSVFLPLAGETTLTLTATVPVGAAPGASNDVVVTGVSQGDPAESRVSTTRIDVINFPPLPKLVSPKNRLLTSDNTPLFTWTHNAYPTPPPGFEVFSYAVEIGSDTGVTTGVVRFEDVTDTAFVPPAPIADGLHFWRTITFNVLGDSSGYSASASFESDATRPDPPALLAPPNVSGGSDRTPTFMWGAVTAKSLAAAGVMMYRWEMSANPAFTSISDSVITPLQSYTVPDFKPFPSCSTVIYWRVIATDPAGNVSDPAAAFRHDIFQVGDVNFDCSIDALDLSALIDYIFGGINPPFPPERSEVNCLPGVDALDLSYFIDYLFAGGPAPCTP